MISQLNWNILAQNESRVACENYLGKYFISTNSGPNTNSTDSSQQMREQTSYGTKGSDRITEV